MNTNKHSLKPNGVLRSGSASMKRSRRLALAAAFTAVACALTACGGSSDGKQDGQKLQDSSPKASGPADEVTWSMAPGLSTLDPTKNIDSWASIRPNLCESLSRYKPDGSIEPALAESVDNTDPKTLVYSIRPDVKFWDGNVMTAEDVAYSLNRNLDPAVASYWSVQYANVASIEATDDTHVTIKLKTADYTVAQSLATLAGGVVERKFAESKGAEFGTRAGGVMCTGPYKPGTWTDDALELNANTDYWDENARALTPKITLKVLQDDATQISALLAGDLDGATVFGSSAARLQTATNGKLYQGPSTDDMTLIVTARPGPLNDVAVRKALSQALPRTGLTKTIYSGTAVPSKSMVSGFTPWSYDSESFDKYFSDLKSLSTAGDVKAAKKAVTDAGAAGKEINIAVSPGETDQKLGQVIVEKANEIGLKAKVTNLTVSQGIDLYYTQESREKFDAFIAVWNTTTTDPLEALNYWMPGGVYNYANYDNAEYAKLVKEATGTADEAKRGDLTRQAITILNNDLPWIPLIDYANLTFMQKDITGAPLGRVLRSASPWMNYIGSAK